MTFQQQQLGSPLRLKSDSTAFSLTLTYSFKNFGIHNLLGGNPKKKKTQTFREYKEDKEEKGRKWFPHMLWVGIASLVVGIILAIVSVIV